jgi:hypothetical protein
LTVIDHGIFTLEIEGKTACMNFNPAGNRYPKELVDSSYARESRYLLKLKDYPWSPELVNFDNKFRRIYFKWYNNTCEDLLPENYTEQLEQIIKDLYKEQIYKPSFYTKYFYVDNADRMHAYAFYSSSDFTEQPINMDFYRPILNEQRSKLVEQLETNGKLDMGILVKHAFTDYIKWPGDPLPKIYNITYGQSLATSSV